jgi:8-oxo-dGTP pyrophosphatase MutT (NUDIX family)
MPGRASAKPRRTSCGVLVTNGARLLIGRNPLSHLWDIPKGLADPGEDFAAAARRELREETGLTAPAEALIPLGVHAYMPGKDLALFLWRPEAMPDPAALVCTAHFRRGSASLPEIDAFAVRPWDEAIARVGKNLARLLTALREGPGWPLRD